MCPREICLLWNHCRTNVAIGKVFVGKTSRRQQPGLEPAGARCFTLKTLLLGVEVVGVAAAAAEDERGAALPLVVVRPLEQLVIAAALVKRLLEALARHGRRRM